MDLTERYYCFPTRVCGHRHWLAAYELEESISTSIVYYIGKRKSVRVTDINESS